MSTFTRLYLGAFAHPQRTFEALTREPRKVGIGAGAVLLTASLYTLMYALLVLGGAAPSSFEPWLAIPKADYYRYDVYLLAPSMFLCWVLAAGVAQLLARLWSGTGTFEDTVAVMGVGISVASWCTLLHDLVGSFLGAIHVIDAKAHEAAMNGPTVWRGLIWTLMVLYALAFVVLFGKGIAAAHRVGRAKATTLGLVAFAVYQLVFLVFNR